jgi:hypothetical protein
VEIFVYLYPALVPVHYPVIRRSAVLGYEWSEATSLPESERREPERKADHQVQTISSRGIIPVSSSTDPQGGWICFLEMDFGEDSRWPSSAGQRIRVGGTGLLVSPRHILTAGQCLFSRSRIHPISRMTSHGPVTELLPIKSRSVLVTPGSHSGMSEPVAGGPVTESKFLRISERWAVSGGTNGSFNFGLITLEKPLPSSPGFWGTAGNCIAPLIDAELQNAVVHAVGYPAHKCLQLSAGTLRSDKNKVETQRSATGHILGVEKHTFTHDMPAFSGQGGSPIWIEQGENRMLVGISTIGQQAVRITFNLLLQLREWMAKDGV